MWSMASVYWRNEKATTTMLSSCVCFMETSERRGRAITIKTIREHESDVVGLLNPTFVRACSVGRAQ